MWKRILGFDPEEITRSVPAPGAGPIITENEQQAGINVKTAIDAHIRWRHRLENFVNGTSEEHLVREVVSADNQCILGKWIHGDGSRRFGHFDLFQELIAVHAQFHQYAGGVLNAALEGDHERAMGLLQSGGYPRTSAKVKHLLAKLYVEVLCAENPVAGHIDPNPPATHPAG